jgi:hypothetical protein
MFKNVFFRLTNMNVNSRDIEPIALVIFMDVILKKSNYNVFQQKLQYSKLKNRFIHVC